MTQAIMFKPSINSHPGEDAINKDNGGGIKGRGGRTNYTPASGARHAIKVYYYLFHYGASSARVTQRQSRLAGFPEKILYGTGQPRVSVALRN